MDLSKLDTVKKCEDGAVLVVLHPTELTPVVDENGKPMTITLAGSDSPKFRKGKYMQANKSIDKRGQFKVTAEQLAEGNIDILAHCTLDWCGVELDGEVLECTVENAKTVYRRFPWLEKQVNEFIDDLSNYLGKSSAS